MKILTKALIMSILFSLMFFQYSGIEAKIKWHPRNKKIVKTHPRPFALKWPEVPRILAKEAYYLFKSGKAIIIDADSKEAYNNYHIIGAKHIPANILQRLTPKQLPTGNMIIIVYCY